MKQSSRTPIILKLSFILIISLAFLNGIFFQGGKEGIIEGYKASENIKKLPSVRLSSLNPDTLRVSESRFSDSILIVPAKRADVYVYGKKSNNKILAWVTFFQAITGLIFGFIGTLFFIKLYNFIASVGHKTVFTIENIKRLIFMGWACFGIALCLVLMDFLDFQAEKGAFDETPFKVVPDIDISFFTIIFGLVLLTIGYAFKKGLELQQENDLTV